MTGLALYFDNATMDEQDAALVIHLLSEFFGERLEVVTDDGEESDDDRCQQDR